MVYEKGGFLQASFQKVASETELAVDDLVRIQVKHRVNFAVPPEELERQTADDLWDHILSEGHDPKYVKVTVEWWTSWGMGGLDGIVYMEYEFCVKHTSPFAISIAVGWSVVILALVIVAWLTQPYWGPLLWRAAGYKAGETPPSPSPDLNMIVVLIVVALIAMVFLFRRH